MPDPTGPDDARLRAEVEAAVEAAIGQEAPAVGVAVIAGCALLTGIVRRSSARASAVEAAFAVPGVTTVHDAIVVHGRLLTHELDEADITRGVAAAIAWAAEDPDSVRAEIFGSTAVLTGQVRWEVERRAVRQAVRRVPGIERVDDRIRVTSPGRLPQPSAP